MWTAMHDEFFGQPFFTKFHRYLFVFTDLSFPVYGAWLLTEKWGVWIYREGYWQGADKGSGVVV